MKNQSLTKEYILECLQKHTYLSNWNSENCCVEDVIRPLRESGCFGEDSWSWDSGVSKLVLIFKGLDFVVKIPFTGSTYYDEHYDEDTEEWVSNEEPTEEYFNLENAPDCVLDRFSKDCWDYCDIECDRFHLASDVGLSDCFAKTEFLGWVNHIPVYIQQRAIMFQDDEARNSRDSSGIEYDSEENVSKVDTLREKTDLWVDRDWTLDFIHYYGETVFEKFAEFCKKWDIEDLHNGNIGYVGGRPCLVDYSSWYSEC